MVIRRAAIVGVAAAILVISVVRFGASQPADRALLGQTLLALLLAWAGAIYLGASIVSAERPWRGAEVAASLAVLALACLGLWGSPKWLAVGYVVHGGWAAAHDPRLVRTRVPDWFPPLCVAFDAVLALWILGKL